MTPIIGIDPGKSGGIAYRSKDGTVTVQRMPETPGDICDLLRSLSLSPDTVAIMEQVRGYTGGEGAPGSAMFNFGQGYGFIQGVLMTLGVRLELIPPQKWMKALGVGVRGDRSKQEWKNHLKSEAQRLFAAHDVKVTLSTCDALLILEYRSRL